MARLTEGQRRYYEKVVADTQAEIDGFEAQIEELHAPIKTYLIELYAAKEASRQLLAHACRRLEIEQPAIEEATRKCDYVK